VFPNPPIATAFKSSGPWFPEFHSVFVASTVGELEEVVHQVPVVLKMLVVRRSAGAVFRFGEICFRGNLPSFFAIEGEDRTMVFAML